MITVTPEWVRNLEILTCETNSFNHSLLSIAMVTEKRGLHLCCFMILAQSGEGGSKNSDSIQFNCQLGMGSKVGLLVAL